MSFGEEAIWVLEFGEFGVEQIKQGGGKSLNRKEGYGTCDKYGKILTWEEPANGVKIEKERGWRRPRGSFPFCVNPNSIHMLNTVEHKSFTCLCMARVFLFSFFVNFCLSLELLL